MTASHDASTSDGLDRLMPFKEAARVFGVAVRTLERHVARGIVPPPIKLGGKRFYPVSVVAAWIERLKEQPAWPR